MQFQTLGEFTIPVTAICVFGAYAFAGIRALGPWYIVISSAQFLVVLSAYISILNIYASSNTHDIS